MFLTIAFVILAVIFLASVILEFKKKPLNVEGSHVLLTGENFSKNLHFQICSHFKGSLIKSVF